MIRCRECNGPLTYQPELPPPYGPGSADAEGFIASCRNEGCGADVDNAYVSFTEIDMDDAAMLLDMLSEVLSPLDIQCIKCGGFDPFKCSWCKDDPSKWAHAEDRLRLGEITETLINSLFPEEQECLFSPASRANFADSVMNEAAMEEFLKSLRKRSQPFDQGVWQPSKPTTTWEQDTSSGTWTGDQITWSGGTA